MKTHFIHYIQVAIALLDLLVLNIVFLVITTLFIDQHLLEDDFMTNYLLIAMNFCWFTIIVLADIYNKGTVLHFENFTKKTLKGYFFTLVLTTAYVIWFQKVWPTSAFALTIISCHLISLLFNRFLFISVFRFYKSRDYLLDKVLVIGYNQTSKMLIKSLEEDSLNKEIVGICEDEDKISELTNYPILSNINEVFEVCKNNNINEIYSTIGPEQNAEIYRLIELADSNCIRFRIIPDISFFVKDKVHMSYISGLPVLAFRNEPLEYVTNRIKKRALDIVVSIFAIVFILSWLVPLLGIIIFLESPGPIFFRQTRTGKNNSTFRCFKFRSMKLNAHAIQRQAQKNDSRLTRVGKFIRKTNLDEMPQFINVLLGHMAVIGPRPHPVTFFSTLNPKDSVYHLEQIYMVRHFIKPGISGWAQVNGYRGEIQESEQLKKRIEYDIWYSENWSILLDLKIMFLTVFNTLKGEKNAF